ncbi:hypothetical protein EGM88_15745 [Aureibaculum marinum]|uniref:Uncharacterized protein n=1 Tax=Aureibaculum marinum TaxID=2487930 RepID=A0A3N4ND69_9FLAO|nr:hypothetical protein [Aureibaculum marinum]RPD90070.1 hypothetical protein EGM88_15745 [Aureibaculum marinum]
MENKTDKNIDKILNVLFNNKRTYGSLGIEHLGDLVYFLEKFDKKRDLDDDELRKTLLLLSRKIVESEIAKISFILAYNYIFPPPSNPLDFDEIEIYINKNWDKMDKVDRYYLIAFEL